MDKNTLRKILLEQDYDIKSQKEGVLRESLTELESVQNIPHIIVIAGLRRVGKSFLLLQFLRRQNIDFYYCNFEDERFLNFTVKDFSILYEVMLELFGEKQNFFFDEIQNIEGWERYVRRMNDKGKKFYITGSNASLLSKELGTKLTGRHIPINLYPYSFKEFLKFSKSDSTKQNLLLTEESMMLKSQFNDYLQCGGMPEYLESDRKRDLLKALYDDILYRDIIVRYKISNVLAFRELSLYLISNVSGLYTNLSLTNFLKLGSINTLKDYLDYLEKSFLFTSLKQFNYSLKVQIIAPKKIYTIDNGLLNVIAFKSSLDHGKLLENLVFIELNRRKKDVYYYKTKNGLEIDFLIKEGINSYEMIQVCSNMSTPSSRTREIKALIEGLKELNLKKGLILTEDEEESIHIEDIEIQLIPTYKWLLT